MPDVSTISTDRFEQDQIQKLFHDNHCVVVRDVIPEQRIAAVRSEIQQVLRAEADRYLDVDIADADRFDDFLEPLFHRDSDYRHRLYETFQQMTSLHRMALNESILSVANQLGITAPNIRSVQTRIDIPEEDEFLQSIHQDLNNARSEQCLNCWMPLQDVTPENGALRVFVGSHELGPIGEEDRELTEQGYQSIKRSVVEDYPEIHCNINAGDALFFGPYVVHASETNRSEHIRWTPIVRFDDATQMSWLQDGEHVFDKYRVTA